MLKSNKQLFSLLFEGNLNTNQNIINNGVTFVNSDFGKAAYFKNSYLSIKNSSTINLIKAFFLRVKFNNNNSNNTLCILKRIRSSSDTDFSLFWDSPNYESGELIVVDFGGLRYTASIAFRSNINRYFDIYAQFDKNDIRVVINNIEVLAIKTTNDKISTTSDVIVGINSPVNTVSTDAIIDNLCFFDKKLTNGEIKRLHMCMHVF